MPPKQATESAPVAASSKATTVKDSSAATKLKAKSKASVDTTTAKSAKTAEPLSSTASKKRKADNDQVEQPQANSQAAKKAKANPAMQKAKPAAIKANAKTVAPAKAASGSRRTTPAPSKPEAPTNESDKENEGVRQQAAPARKRKATGAVAKKEEEQQGGEDEKEEDESPPPSKRSKKSPAPKEPAAKKRAVRRKAAAINKAPTDILDVFVFGEGSNGELGLGNTRLDGKKPRDVKRPRLNPFLSAGTARIVQVTCGGMHAAALTADNKILTWGVNDMSALGRNTAWEGGLRDADDESDDDDADDLSGMNPHESTPGEVDMSEVEPDTVFVQVVASDSATFALTEEGRVYGWGAFRNDEGILGFDKTTLVQKVPRLMPKPLEKITQLAAGSNHILALDANGKIFTWGSGQHDQLGRKTIVKRGTAHNKFTGEEGLTPAGIAALPIKRKRGEEKALPRKIACGAYHSFILDNEGRVYSWGLNNYGELGNTDDAGTDNASSPVVRLVDSLTGFKIADIDGGEHHSLACTDTGKLITWGRIDGHQTGLKEEDFNKENAVFDDHNRARILKVPTLVPDMPKVKCVAGGTDHNFALTDDGQAYSWGFSANYQTGQGTDEDIKVPTLIDNTAVRGRKLVFAGAGGQFSVLASVAEVPTVNGSA